MTTPQENESGRDEIYVPPFPNTTISRWQLSNGGGSAARWSRSGRELYFVAGNGDLMAVPTPPGTTFSPGEPRSLFNASGTFFPSVIVPNYDLTPGDAGFIMVRLAAVSHAPGAGQLVVVENWFDELRRAMRPREN